MHLQIFQGNYAHGEIYSSVVIKHTKHSWRDLALSLVFQKIAIVLYSQPNVLFDGTWCNFEYYAQTNHATCNKFILLLMVEHCDQES